MITEHMGGLRPTIPNYSDDLESRSVPSGPLVKKLLDGEVELLVRLAAGSDHDPVDFAQGDCSRILIA